MPSFSATGTFTETRALREGSVIQPSSEPSFCSTLARIRPERVLEPYPNWPRTAGQFLRKALRRGFKCKFSWPKRRRAIFDECG
jgi:hypothetical protein